MFIFVGLFSFLCYITFSFSFIYFLFPTSWSTAVTSRSRPGQIKDHKTPSKHSDSVYKMDPSKCSQGWPSQEVFYFKRFLFPWGREQASMSFKWKPNFAVSLKGTQLQQSSCSLFLPSAKAVFTRSTRGSVTALLLHLVTACIILKCFQGPSRNSILLEKTSKTIEKLFFALITKDYPLRFGLPPTSA